MGLIMTGQWRPGTFPLCVTFTDLHLISIICVKSNTINKSSYCRIPPEEEKFLQHKDNDLKRPQFTDVSNNFEKIEKLL